MTNEVAARELRNNVSEVLRRVEAGERLLVTVSGRPVAELVPLRGRPSSVPWTQFQRDLDGHRADSGLTGELQELYREADEWV